MTQLIYIDSGNTNMSIAKHSAQGEWDIETFAQANSQKYLNKIPADAVVVVSSVRDSEKIKLILNKKHIPSINVSDFKKDQAFYDFKHNYAESIGDDRIVQIYHISKRYKNSNVALIDAGSFITSDFILAGDYKGGTISPGIELFLSNYKQGQELPEISLENFQMYLTKPKDVFPKNTNDAIFQGAYEYLRQMVLKLKKLNIETLIITGGNADIFKELVKFLDLDINILINENLIFEAMEEFFLNLDNTSLIQ
jgi:type III pantothenate kinase